MSSPRWVAVAGITLTSIAASLVTTIVVVFVLGGSAYWPAAIFIAVLIPSLVAPSVSWVVLGTMHELELARAEAVRLANTDLLTGAMNRRRFMQVAQSEFEAARRGARSFSLVLLDIDDFKSINDRYGHRTGDEVLQMVVRNCVAALRPCDYVARWGGEEFVALLPSAGVSEAREVALRMSDAIRQGAHQLSDGELRISASIGVASTEMGIDSLDRLLVMADRAMYHVKRSGKNSVVVADHQHRTGLYSTLPAAN